MKYVLVSVVFLVSCISRLVDVPRDFFNNYHLNLALRKIVDSFAGFYIKGVTCALTLVIVLSSLGQYLKIKL